MKQVRLGLSGLRLSQVILGTAGFGDTERSPWSIGANAVWPLVRHAFDSGITAFDTGSTYGAGLSEERLGRALAQLGNRDGIVISTKIFFPTGVGSNDRGLSRKHLLAALDRSLARLRTDYVDVLMIHRWDPSTPIEETLNTLDQIVRSGRARYIGASSMSAWRLMKALGLQRARHWNPFVVMQGLYNLLYREEEREMIPLCTEEGLGYMAWSPLARGRLAGPQADPIRLTTDPLVAARFDTAADTPMLELLDQAVVASGRSHASLAIGWLTTQGVLPVIGASRPEEIDVAISAAGEPLEQDVLSAMTARYRPHSVLGFDPRDEIGSA